MVAFAKTKTLTPNGSPNIAYAVIGRMQREHGSTDHSNTSVVDLCVIFRHKLDSFRFQMRLVSVGGTVCEAGTVSFPDAWYESVDDANHLIGL